MATWKATKHGKTHTNTRCKLVRNAETTGIGQDESIATSLKDSCARSSLLPTNLRHMLAKRYKQQACRGFYSLKSAGRHLACTGASGHRSNSKAVHLEIPCITLEEQMAHRYQSSETPWAWSLCPFCLQGLHPRPSALKRLPHSCPCDRNLAVVVANHLQEQTSV